MKKILIFICTAFTFVSCNMFTNLETYPSFSDIYFESIGDTYADVYCELSKTGSYEIEELGFVISTSPNAATTGNAYPARISKSDFYQSFTNLTPNTKYYICAYAKLTNGKYYVGNELSFTTLKKGDYTGAKVNSGNYKIDLNLISCLRTGNRVTIEATVLNKSITPYTSFSTAEIGLTKLSYLTHVEDDVFTDYSRYDMTLYLNNTSGNSLSSAIMPIGVTKKFTITIDNVPHSATKLNVYIAGQFYYTNPTEYCYFTFENVPIY